MILLGRILDALPVSIRSFLHLSTLPPKFPQFAKLNYKDKKVIEYITSNFAVYSDFNFTSAYTWNIRGTHMYSAHLGNLILRLDDYTTGQPVYTVLGDNNVAETIKLLKERCKKDTETCEIKLIPECTVQALSKDFKNTELIEDEDNFDYIFSLQELADLQGRRFKSKRQAANRCARNHNITFTELFTVGKKEVDMVKSLVEKWSKEKSTQYGENNASVEEIQALSRVFKHFNREPTLLLTFAYIDNDLVGFSIDELLHDKHVISHYFKTLPSTPGLSEHFNRAVAQSLYSKGFLYWNWEQDLGIAALRQMKKGYRPIRYNKKYRIITT